jgi:hypothetical protein
MCQQAVTVLLFLLDRSYFITLLNDFNGFRSTTLFGNRYKLIKNFFESQMNLRRDE